MFHVVVFVYFVAVLNESGIKAEHCILDNSDGIVTLYPCMDAPSSINGVPVTLPTALSQGSVLEFHWLTAVNCDCQAEMICC